MTTVRDNLIAARALIDTPEKWTKNAKARNAAGRSVSPAGGSAVCWCGFGALVKVCGPREAENVAYAAFHGPGNIAGLNDRPETTHSDIMALFDRAIAAQDETP